MRNISAAVAIGATAVMLVAGCGEKAATEASSTKSSSSSSSSASSSASASPSTAAAADYTRLLLAAEDIQAPGDTFTAQEPTVDPGGKPGVATVYSNAEDTREIGDTIFVLPDAAAANTAMQGAVAAFGASVVGGEPETVDIGSGASAVSGTSPDGTKSVAVLVFTEGTAFTTLQFDSGIDDPVPAEFVLDVAQKQAAKVKAGLAG